MEVGEEAEAKGEPLEGEAEAGTRGKSMGGVGYPYYATGGGGTTCSPSVPPAPLALPVDPPPPCVDETHILQSRRVLLVSSATTSIEHLN
jgi:hypothetical protein